MKKPPEKQKRKNRTLREFLKIYGFGFFVATLILVIAYQFVAPAPPKKMTVATASSGGAYFAFASEYKKHLAKENIELEILETSGSAENLQLLADKKVEVAFVQGGVGDQEDYPELRGLGSLYLEPLWIFVKKGAKVTTLADLTGKRIAIGPEGSGTREIALQLFEDNDMLKGNKVELLPIGGEEGAKGLFAGDIDVLFMVTSVGSPLVQKLFLDPRTELTNLSRAESYARLHSYLSHIVLPQGVLDMANNIPETDIHFIAPAATLVISDELHPALIDLLMQIVTKVHRGGAILAAGRSFPSPDNLDFPLSKEAERFYKNGPPFLQRYLPFWAASLIDRLKVMLLPMVALILPLMKILPPTYRWRMRSRIYRWYDELHDLDLHTRENAKPDVITAAIATLDSMEHEVRQVEVPLSYAEELYNLRLHIDLLRNQLHQLLKAL